MAMTLVRLTELFWCVTEGMQQSQIPFNVRESLRLSKSWLRHMKDQGTTMGSCRLCHKELKDGALCDTCIPSLPGMSELLASAHRYVEAVATRSAYRKLCEESDGEWPQVGANYDAEADRASTQFALHLDAYVEARIKSVASQ